MEDAPRPRILLESVPEALFDSLMGLGPTVGRFPDEIESIHPTDWDLVVSFHEHPEEPDGVHVLSFGGREYSRAKNFFDGSVQRRVPLYARAVQRDEHCPDEFASLVDRTIVATAPKPPRNAFASGPLHWFAALATIGTERAPYAGIIEAADGSLTLALPEHTTDEASWVAAFIGYLRTLEPDRFPGLPAWKLSRAWGTRAMRVSFRAIEEVAAERTAQLARLAAEEAQARAALTDAAATGAAGAQRLLTADGDNLVEAVRSVLTDLGFAAESRDDHHDSVTGAKLEDLLVSDDEWRCLVEVKGYTKGAKVNEVPKVTGRPSVAYAAEHGRPPDAVWHVVNAWRDTDPSTRPTAVPNELDLTPLTESNGCLVDTRDLFRAWRDVEEGHRAAADVRGSLRSAITRWSWPPGQG